MNIRTKQGGEWVHLSTLTDHLGVLDVTINAGRAAGDVDGDGTITYQDALLVSRYIVGLKKLDTTQQLAADVCEPVGQITEEDAQAISNYQIDLETGFQGYVISGENWTWAPTYLPERFNEKGEALARGRYIYTIELLGIQPSFSVIGLFDTNLEGVFQKIVCQENKIELVCTCIPTKPVHASLIYTAEGANSSIFLMGGMTDKQQQQIIDTITTQLPVKVAADGYTDIKKQRPVTNIHNKRDGNKLEITYTLKGEETQPLVDIINLDSKGRPLSGTSNGVKFDIEWDGF